MVFKLILTIGDRLIKLNMEIIFEIMEKQVDTYQFLQFAGQSGRI